jgi:hypothetical protein
MVEFFAYRITRQSFRGPILGALSARIKKQCCIVPGVLRLMDVDWLMREVLKLKLGLAGRYRSTKDQQSRV